MSTNNEEEPPFFTRDGKTFIQVSGEDITLFGDFSLRLLGEIIESGHWVCVCVARVLGRLEER